MNQVMKKLSSEVCHPSMNAFSLSPEQCRGLTSGRARRVPKGGIHCPAFEN